MDEFEFEDEEPFEFDEEPLFEEEEEEIEFEEEEEARPAPNRAFLIGLAVLAGVFVLSLCAVLLIILTRDTGPGEIELTNTAIMLDLSFTQTAAAQETDIALTQIAEQTLSALATMDTEATQTAIAALTATALAMATDTPTPTETPEPTEFAQVATPTPEEILTEEPPVTVVTATPPGAFTPAPTTPEVPVPTMPDTGIADELGLGGSLALAGVMAFGLLAVMFVARHLRTSAYDDDDEADEA